MIQLSLLIYTKVITQADTNLWTFDNSDIPKLYIKEAKISGNKINLAAQLEKANVPRHSGLLSVCMHFEVKSHVWNKD
jgi:hypothetical protein